MKRALYALALVPLVLFVCISGSSLATAIASGDISVVDWIMNHKFLLAFIGCYLLLGFVGPFKKK